MEHGIRGMSGHEKPKDGRLSEPAPPGANVSERRTDLGFFGRLADFCSRREVPGSEAAQRPATWVVMGKHRCFAATRLGCSSLSLNKLRR
jgi:hypothetical protein